MVGGKGKGKGTTARPGQVVLGVAPYPPPHPPVAFSGCLRVVVEGKSKGKGTSAGPTEVVLGVAHRPPPSCFEWGGRPHMPAADLKHLRPRL